MRVHDSQTVSNNRSDGVSKNLSFGILIGLICEQWAGPLDGKE